MFKMDGEKAFEMMNQKRSPSKEKKLTTKTSQEEKSKFLRPLTAMPRSRSGDRLIYSFAAKADEFLRVESQEEEDGDEIKGDKR